MTFLRRRCLLLLTVLGSLVSSALADDARLSTPAPLTADVIVYGDASGGVAAAVQAARMGKSVILVSQFGHLGGMTSSGLGWTDIGNSSILGGISREFYHRLYNYYQDDNRWNIQPRSKYKNLGQGVPAFDEETELASTFEPKAAEWVFDQLMFEAGVRIVRGRIDLEKGTTKQGTRIVALHLEDGRQVSGKMFIDASYEGDLLAAAGVSFTTGREPNAKYGETHNGVTGPQHGNQLPDGIDPFVVPGKSSSGLLPGVNPDMGGPRGTGDHHLQAYCYRMVLTDVPENRSPITKPTNYREEDYEILFRAIEAGQTGAFFKTDMMPNRKTDSNNASGISTDFIGGNYGDDWNWVTISHAEREKVAQKHRDWQLGLLWTLQNHPRVPENIRKSTSRWGLAKDEFEDNNYWPHNIYVREARRMVSDFVMTEHHCRGTAEVPEPIGMGAYTLDSHNTQRFLHKGMVKNEGDIQSRLKAPYSISYRAIVPPADECENLLVPWSLSASHIAFGSIRMEPVFMILGQSAGTAASMAIDDNLSVQEVPYEALRERLVEDDQRLTPSSN
ncbi:FAD-dependent oxidoreductase [Aeoliella sp. SH292]|uniref:FAD-dependent oxidoreductase n=1 Tax=Aeoliella sp. SH292 TaxID=3454464 RepID=UPI003F9C7FFC